MDAVRGTASETPLSETLAEWELIPWENHIRVFPSWSVSNELSFTFTADLLIYLSGHMPKKRLWSRPRMKLINKSRKYSGDEMTIIPLLYKNAKCSQWEKSKLQAGGTSQQCVRCPWQVLRKWLLKILWDINELRDSEELNPVWMRWRFGKKNSIRNDSPIPASVRMNMFPSIFLV